MERIGYNEIVPEMGRSRKGVNPMVNIHKLKGRMVEKGYTQCALAKSIGMSDNTLSSRMNLRTPFNTDEIERICDTLDIISDKEKIDIFLADTSQNRDEAAA